MRAKILGWLVFSFATFVHAYFKGNICHFPELSVRISLLPHLQIVSCNYSCSYQIFSGSTGIFFSRKKKRKQASAVDRVKRSFDWY